MFFDASTTSCSAAGNWKRLPSGALFRAVRSCRVRKLKRMLQDEKWQTHVNDLDGDGCGLLHILAMSSVADGTGRRRKYSSKEVRNIVQAIHTAGGSLNLLSGVTNGFVHGTHSGSGVVGASYFVKDEEIQVVDNFNNNNNNFLSPDAHNETPMWLASYYGNYPVVKALLSEGACPHAPNARGITPVMVAKVSVKSRFHRRLGIKEEDCLKTLEFLQDRMKLEEEEI